MKEFTFITTVRISSNIAKLYPNYYINAFTPKSLAKRFASGNSSKNSLKEFGFEYKTREIKKNEKDEHGEYLEINNVDGGLCTGSASDAVWFMV